MKPKYLGILVVLVLAVIVSCEWSESVDPPPPRDTLLSVPSEYSTIQHAIDAAREGDIVEVADGVYEGVGNTNLTFGGKLITLRSKNGASATKIDCKGSSLSPRRAFVFNGDEDSNLVIEGLTISRGYPSGAGTDQGARGGGVYVETSSPRFVNCAFSGNSAEYGGAVFCRTASPIFENCTFSQNTAEDGAAFNCDGNAKPKIRNCTFSDNYATVRGGAIYCLTASPVITGTTFGNNRASSLGGAVYCGQSSPSLSDCILYRNNASAEGGAIYATINSNPTITNCTMVSNSAVIGGGLSCSNDSEPRLTYSLIAFSQGGGAVRSADDINFPSLSCCNIYSNSGGDWVGDSIAAQANQKGNISLNPLLCDPSAGDVRLKEGSPCFPDNNSCQQQIGALVGICPE